MGETNRRQSMTAAKKKPTTKYGAKESHNPILAIYWSSESSLFIIEPAGYAKTDCAAWMKKEQVNGKVLFARFVTELEGGTVETYRVKEVIANGPEKKEVRDAEGAETEADPAGKEAGDQG